MKRDVVVMGGTSMFPVFVFAIAAVVGGVLLFRAFLSADPRVLARGVKALGFVLVGLFVVGLFAIGGVGTVMAVSAVLVPVALRWRALQQQLRAGRGPNPGQRSSIDTLFFRMSLEHDTGAMYGEVLRGPYRGARLERLPLADLLVILDECRRQDQPSAEVLKTFLDRMYPDWRTRDQQRADGGRAHGAGAYDSAGRDQGEEPRGGRQGGSRQSGGMTIEEACEILGVARDASEAEIKDAHRRLMLKLHPDQGGSTYLAAKINQAKDLLLRR